MKKNFGLMVALLALVLAAGAIYIAAQPEPEARFAQPYYSGSFRVQDYLRLVPDVTVVATNTTAALVPGGDYAYKSYNVSSGATMTVSNIISGTGATDGDILVIDNIGAGSVVVADGADVQGAGAMTLGQYDSIWFIYKSSEWIERGRSNN